MDNKGNESDAAMKTVQVNTGIRGQGSSPLKQKIRKGGRVQILNKIFEVTNYDSIRGYLHLKEVR